MKKLLCIGIITSFLCLNLQADMTSQMSMSPKILNNPGGTNNSTNNQQQQQEKKLYSEILSYLESQGDGENLFYLSQFYLNGSYEKDTDGKVVEKDTKKAIKYLTASSEKGFSFASITLGSLYLYHEDFIVIPNNIELSEKYLNIALKQGLPEANTILADIYFNYKGKSDIAIEYLSAGASENVATSEYALAVIYNAGLKDNVTNIPKSEDMANYFLTKACTNKKITTKIKEICEGGKIAERAEITK